MNSAIRHLACLAVALLCIPAPAHAQPAQGPASPASSAAGKIQERSLRVGDHDRSYLVYLPASLAPGNALVIVLHGTGMKGQMMRRATGAIFERLAEQDGFVVAYPDAYQGNWHDCRREVASAAKAAGIDDVGFLKAVRASIISEFKVDPARVFLFGYSGGGHMGFRLAFEAPDEIAAVAAVAASLPPAESISCARDGRTPRMMLVNGTADATNPYNGGPHAAGGSVVSSRSSAEALARLNQLGEPAAETTVQAALSGDPTSVQLLAWRRGGQTVVAHYSVQGGGHVIPQPAVAFPAQLGPTSKFDSPTAAWEFFNSR